MSHLATYIMHPEGNMDINSFMKFDDDMKNYDIPVTTAELMSSEFFDVVLSMEKETSNNLLNDDYLNPVHVEVLTDPQLPTPIDPSDNDSSNETEPVTFESVNDQLTIYHSPAKVVKEPTKRIIMKPAVNKVVANKPVVNKPIVNKSILNAGGKKNCKNKQPPIRVQPITANGRSLLLKQYKVLDTANITNSPSATYTALFNRAAMEKGSPSSSESVDEEIEVEYEVENGHNGNSRYPPLLLNSEEKRLLQKEGITLPSHYPLTKNEEKELKRIRRKIRNKISAQDSRKRKKEYVDKLEEKAKRTSDENEFLKRRIKVLRKQNSRLMEQMQKLQRLLFSTTTSKATPTTCLMIVLFSTLLVCLPNLNLLENKDVGEQQLFAARRALLYNKQSGEEDGLNMDEFVTFNKDEETELENIAEPESEVPMRQFSKMLSEISQIYSHPIEKNRSEGSDATEQLDRESDDDNMIDILGLVNECMEVDKKKKKFIEPDISDDEGPPIAPRKRPYSDANAVVEEPPAKVIIHESIPIDFEYLNQLNAVHSPNISGEDELFTAIESAQFMAQE